MKIRFIKETREPIATADGPGVRVYKVGDEVDVEPWHAAMYLGSGQAKPVRGSTQTATAADGEKATKPLDRMNKAELIARAAELGVEHAEDATKAVILAAITAAGEKGAQA